MRTMIVDTDVVSYIYKKDTRAEKYEPHLVNSITSISFMTLAATALLYDAELVTHNATDFSFLPGIRIIREP
jgi:predicted nucleic acid-binding protein